MGGSKTITYKDLQVQKLMDDPEKAYKVAMRQAYKNVGSGMRSVIREYQQGIIDARSMFHDTYLTNLGYNPKEVIPYSIVDPVLVKSWLLSNVSRNISEINSYKWAIPSLEEIALEYLQDTYSGMSLADKSFLIGNIIWYVSGVTNVSTTMTNATCYKDRMATAEKYAVSVGLVVASVEDIRYNISGTIYWKVAMTNGSVVDVPVEYTTIECPGVGSDVVQAIVTEYNGKEYPVQSNEYDTDDMGNKTPLWSNVVRVSAYIGNDGGVKVTGTALRPVYSRFNSSRYLEATKEAVANIVDQVEKEIANDLNEELDRLVVVYTLNGLQKLKLAEINKSLVSNTTTASAYPIIPLRENYAFVKETNQMKAVLNKLGMATDDFETSLDNSKIKNAAIMFLLDLKDDSDVGTKVVYETLVNMVRTTIPASGKTAASEVYQLNLGFSDVNMKSSINFGLKTVSGVIGSVGSYVRYSKTVEYTEEVEGGGADQSWTTTETKTGTVYGIRKQVTESYYEEMEFGGCSTSWKVGGYALGGVLNLGQDDGEVYIPITDLGLEGLRYEELHYAVARSLNMMALSIVKVKTKWYQSGFFKFVMIVAIVAVTIATAGASIGATASGITALTGASVATATAIATTALVVTTTLAVASMMGVDVGVLGSVATVIGIAQMGAGMLAQTGSMSTGQTVLTSAKALTSAANMAIEINTKGALKAMQDRLEAINSKLEESSEELKKLTENVQQGIWMGIEDRMPDTLYMMSSTDMMCNYAILYDYDGMIDGQISSIGI